MSRLLDPSFPWTPACATDIRVTFRKAMQQTEADDWRSRVEGAREVLRHFTALPHAEQTPSVANPAVAPDQLTESQE